MAKEIKIILTRDEYNLLNEITRQTKTDCWFCLDTDEEGFDCVRDLERGHKVTLQFAVKVLNEALDGCTDLVDLTIRETKTYGQLMKKLELSNPFEEEM